ncbi:MAG TPA: amino acid adenylation domain-containing protein, partial [Pyrinomonadaceae bacterium]|nr:amino acid adenylation domain-containing protein [Pyrinomonadaceae bacterium]
MTTVEFLSYLRSLNTRVWLDGGRLRCSAPSGVLTPDLREKLAERKAEIIRFLSQVQNSLEYESASILPQTEDGHAPLSFAQQRLWFLDQLDPGNFTYNIPLAVRLRGKLNVAALERSLTEIVRRHETLRTTFALVEGEPVQIVAPPAPVSLPVVDLRHLPEAERERQVRQMAEDEAMRPFNLAEGPLFRVNLLKVEEEHHIALLTIHHIVSDEWSKAVLMRELGELYNAFARGLPSPLAELPIQYRDFARWQRQWLKGEVLESQLSFWKEQLQGLPPLLELPADRPRTAIKTLDGARQQFILSPALSAALKTLAAREGATLFMVMLAAFKALLYRYTGQRDIVVGTPTAGRTRAETEDLIGFFINTLVLRTELTGRLSFRELLAKVREVCLGAYAHQDLPFEKLVEELQPERDTSRNPLFQVAFQILNTPRGSLNLSDLSLEPLESSIKATKFDITLSMVDTPQGLGGSLVYSSELFDETTIKRLISHFQTMIEGIVADPEKPISTLPLLQPDERRDLLSRWGKQQTHYVADRGLHELFEAQVERAPHETAVVFEDVRLSYDALNRRANQLAHYLRRLGVGREDRVGILMERSHEVVVAILAVLKAGAAYVPMDTAYPKDRLAFMLTDASMPVLLTQERLLETLPAHNSRIVCVDAESEAVNSQSEANPSVALAGDNLAYVIYTSGSTGKPKGVLVTHANVVRLFASTQEHFHFDERDVWTLFHSYAFDFSVWELWGALLYGGRLVVVPYLTTRSPESFYELLLQEQVTVLNQTPSAFRQLLKTEGVRPTGAPFFNPRLIIFGGEALELQSLSPWFEKHPERQTQLVNMYGITETTVHVTYRPIGSGEHAQACGSLIGSPLPDLQMYVLDEHLQPQPIGVTGELYIGGDGLARGYLQRPELTAQRFIPNPFSTEPGARLYKSGDLGRYLPDRDTEYCGRIDHQVKLRGYRIELGEIEAALLEDGSVHEAVVVISEDAAEDKRLVAYVVPSSVEEAGIVGRLRESLKARLPDYMVPSAFVVLEHLPLTPHGKVDRRALPAPERTRSTLESTYVAPRDLLELQLVNLWEEVLEVKPVGVTDDFFDIGGHSLLAVKLFALIQERLNKSLPLATLFQKGTIEH